jgi:hypothetical protein
MQEQIDRLTNEVIPLREALAEKQAECDRLRPWHVRNRRFPPIGRVRPKAHNSTAQPQTLLIAIDTGSQLGAAAPAGASANQPRDTASTTGAPEPEMVHHK